MTPEIGAVLAILALSIALFLTERLPMDLVALLVLAALALTGLITPAEALSGFSNAAVVTVGGVFVLSASLARAGVASILGRHIVRVAGGSEARLVAVIMLVAAVLSAFMNNVGVTALLLPMVVDMARHLRRPPSKLLMPLAYGSLLGGLTTLIGTPPNILVSDLLAENGLRPFGLLDYTPVGVVAALAGIACMTLVGRRFLPTRDLAGESTTPRRADLAPLFRLDEQLFVLRVPEGSPLGGKTLAESRLGAVMGLTVLAILRNHRTHLAPGPATPVQEGDRLLVRGSAEHLLRFGNREYLVLEDAEEGLQRLVSPDIAVAEAELAPESPLVANTLRQANFRRRFGANVLAIVRDGVPRRTNLQDLPLRPRDVLLVQGPLEHLETLQDTLRLASFRMVSDVELADVYRIHERLFVLRVPEGSPLTGRTLAQSHLGDAFGLTVLGVIRGGETRLLPGPEEVLAPGDLLLVEGRPETLLTLRGLQDLRLERPAALALHDLESGQVGLAEVVLSPHTTLVGKTLRQLHFREKYGLSVLTLWREGQVHHAHLRDMPLRFGDALLVYGPRERLAVLGSEPDFLVLTEVAPPEPLSRRKMTLAFLVMAGVLLSVVLGWLPISLAALAGAALVVLGGCLSMEEAYRAVEWRAIFLIAGMLPLGIAMERTGTAGFLAEGVVALTGQWGPLAVVAGLFLATVLLSQVLPNPAVVVLALPIALETARELHLSPYALAMTVALAASASFLSPVSHPANVLVMGPGGYRFADYLKAGSLLTLAMLAVALGVLPLFWPLTL